MKKTLPRPSTRIAAFLVLLLMVGYAGHATAQVPPTPPNKVITIYNNSTKETIFPVLAAYVGAVDLWMQAQFKDEVKDVNTQTFCNNDPFNTSCAAQSGVPQLYRAYINPKKGVLPGEFVSITVPFYLPIQLEQAAQPLREAGGHGGRRRAGCLSLADRR